jgi:H+/Cl- antiporter ClcA
MNQIVQLFANIDFSAIMGALVGSFFYMLIRLQPFLENRTFDPKYNSAYFTRFVTGVVAGVILAYVVKAYVTCDPSKSNNAIACLSPAIIGILGGFSAEAVEQVLQRLVEVLLSTIRGDNSGQVQAKATAQQTAKFADVRDKLDNIGKAKTDDEKTAAIDAAKALLKRSDC